MSKEQESGTTTPESPAAPYISFKTFQTALDRLDEGIPHQIDKSVWPTIAFGTRGQVISAFKFLGLIDDKGVPQPDLRSLAGVKEQDRKPILRKLLEKRFPEIMRIDLTKATPVQLEDAMRKYNVSGATHRKAMTFFLQAAQFSSLPMSQFLQAMTKRGAAPGTARKRRARANGNAVLVDPANPLPSIKTGSGTSRIISLSSGGKLTLEVELDVLRLSGDDRKFVFDLIDKLEEYENKNKKETASE